MISPLQVSDLISGICLLFWSSALLPNDPEGHDACRKRKPLTHTNSYSRGDTTFNSANIRWTIWREGSSDNTNLGYSTGNQICLTLKLLFGKCVLYVDKHMS